MTERIREKGQRTGQRSEAINNRVREQHRVRETEREGQVRQQIIGERKEREQHRGSQRKRDGRQKEKNKMREKN